MSKKNWILLSVVFIFCSILFLPASLLRFVIKDQSPVKALNWSGTLWKGSVVALVRQPKEPLVFVSWYFCPVKARHLLGVCLESKYRNNHASLAVSVRPFARVLSLRQMRLDLNKSVFDLMSFSFASMLQRFNLNADIKQLDWSLNESKLLAWEGTGQIEQLKIMLFPGLFNADFILDKKESLPMVRGLIEGPGVNASGTLVMNGAMLVPNVRFEIKNTNASIDTLISLFMERETEGVFRWKREIPLNLMGG